MKKQTNEENEKPILDLYFCSVQAVKYLRLQTGETVIAEAEHEVTASYAVSIEDAAKKAFKKAKKKWSLKDGWSHSVYAAQFDLSGKFFKESDVNFVE